MPPQPKPDRGRGLMPVEREALQQEFWQDLQAWREALPPEQLEALRQRQRTSPDSGTGAGESDYDWKELADRIGLTPADVERLQRDKLMIEDVQLKQIFEAYTEPQGPVFVTSDVLLNAFMVLFEDSMREVELRRAGQLRIALESLVESARKEMASERNAYTAEALRGGWERAQRVVGPAACLLGTDPEFFDEAVRVDIAREVARIRAAAVVALPEWVGPPRPSLQAIDYRSMRPVGLYAGGELLQNYFRAVRWLQTVPLRAEVDEELTAIALLGYAHGRRGQAVFDDFTVWWGRQDDRGLEEASHEFQNLLDGRGPSGAEADWDLKLADRRRWLLRERMDTEAWGRLRNTLQLPDGGEEELAEWEFRVLSGFRLPDALALQGDGKPGAFRPGLVVAAMLGSELAWRELDRRGDVGRDDEFVAAGRAEWRPEDLRKAYPPSLYDDYLEVLAALVELAEPDAPEFMRGEAWAAKSNQTLLAGWAQMRHAATLQAKESALYFGMVMVPPGFVEPNPTFHHRFANLVARVLSELEKEKVFEPSVAVEVDRLRQAADAFEALGLHREGATAADFEALSEEQQRDYQAAMHAGSEEVFFGVMVLGTEDDSPVGFAKAHADYLQLLRQKADDLEAGRVAPPEGDGALEGRWRSLERLTRQLEAMVHKQLRGQAWTPEEERLLRGFGEAMGGVMGYDGNSWLTPRDDAPRWTAVLNDPAFDRVLAVGTGRPRLIHVLYPWNGHEVLCQGAVMSYYEYAARERLTDGEWLELLDSKYAPALPEWVEPILVR
ncbi:DUF3160 domain-containing protein [Actomonas aquatica]|uniref:DUF3160 domain-containing protein n=1 Tax=Actomonas aquatica TaxID=2866162 RepID=A0ABZ1C630_9BACT|nr:DUF3160 domain-containing protein [Opitutus sp. WL0086]WRQ86867.1 DUF3160 domain-containing protein [Opitutus sp. WL0086]